MVTFKKVLQTVLFGKLLFDIWLGCMGPAEEETLIAACKSPAVANFANSLAQFQKIALGPDRRDQDLYRALSSVRLVTLPGKKPKTEDCMGGGGGEGEAVTAAENRTGWKARSGNAKRNRIKRKVQQIVAAATFFLFCCRFSTVLVFFFLHFLLFFFFSVCLAWPLAFYRFY